MDREDYLVYFQHMEDEERHDGPLGGMAWDDISDHAYDAVEIYKLFTREELKTLFPSLFR